MDRDRIGSCTGMGLGLAREFGVDFASRENSDATKRPKLIVTFAG